MTSLPINPSRSPLTDATSGGVPLTSSCTLPEPYSFGSGGSSGGAGCPPHPARLSAEYCCDGSCEQGRLCPLRSPFGAENTRQMRADRRDLFVNGLITAGAFLLMCAAVSAVAWFFASALPAAVHEAAHFEMPL